MHDACSSIAREREEPLLGTASVGQRYVLLSWPKGQWAAKALQAPELTPVTSWAKGHDARYPGKTVLRLFAAPTDAAGVEARIFPVGVRVRGIPLFELPTRLDALFEDLDAGRRPDEVEPCPRTIAVCTHGKHDQCCARYGQALFRALRDRADELEADVVETSHLGGHRFAGTLIDFVPGEPGRMYGRLQASDIDALVQKLSAGEVWLERYRGRVDLVPEAQVAEGVALARGAGNDVTLEPLDAHRWVARWSEDQLEVAMRRLTIQGPKGCGGEEETWSRAVPAPSGAERASG